MPRRNSFSCAPVAVLNTRISVPLSLAVAHLDPSLLSAIQLSLPECAAIMLTLAVGVGLPSTSVLAVEIIDEEDDAVQ